MRLYGVVGCVFAAPPHNDLRKTNGVSVAMHADLYLSF